MTSARSFSILASEVSTRDDKLRRAPELVNRAVDRHRANAPLELVNIGFNIAGGHVRGGHCIHMKQLPSVQEVQEVAVPPGKIIARNRLEMGGAAAALEALGRLAGSHPCVPVGFGPEFDRQ
jgi:hypothetical protein